MSDEYDENEYYDDDSGLDDADFDIESSDDDDDDDGYYDSGLDDLDGDGIFSSSSGSTTEPKKEETKQEEPIKEEKPEVKAPENASDLIKKISKEFQTRCLELSSTTKDYSSLADLLWGSELLSQGIKDKVEELIAQPQFEAQHIKDACKFFTGFFDLAIRGGIDYDKFTDDKEKKLGFASLTALGAIFKQAGNNAAANEESAQGTIDSMAKMIDDSKTIATNNMKEGQTPYTEDDYKKDLENIVKFVVEKRTSMEIPSRKLGLLQAFFGMFADDYWTSLRTAFIEELTPMWSVHPYKAVLYGIANSKGSSFSPISEQAKLISTSDDYYSIRLMLNRVSLGLPESAGLVPCLKRNYDAEAIITQFKQNSKSFVYFPVKHKEFISKSIWGFNQEGFTQAPADVIKSADSYYDSVIAKHLQATVYSICSSYLDSIKPSWDSQMAIEDDNRTASKFLDFILYLFRCLTSVMCVTQLDSKPAESGGHTTARFGFRIISAGVINKVYPETLSKALPNFTCDGNDLRDICPKNTHKFASGEALTKKWVVHSVGDKDYVYAVPQFAYKVLKMLQSQGRQLAWTGKGAEILIGENEDFTPYSFVNGSSEFYNKSLHCIFAGSRSGKGVMCSNLFCTAIASGVPIYYMDRKPDTATLLYGLSGKKMFAINGGDYKKKFDPNGFFKDSQDINNFKIPSGLKDSQLFCDVKRLNDCCYVKGALLVLEMLSYLNDVSTGEFAKWANEHKLADKGSIIVLDEINNFISGYSNTVFGQGLGTYVSFQRSLPNIGKPKKDQSAEDFASEVQAKVDRSVTEKTVGIYGAILLNGIRNLYKTLSGLTRAGKTGIMKNVHMFVIGQDVGQFASDVAFVPSETALLADIASSSNSNYFDVSKSARTNHFLSAVLSTNTTSADFMVGFGGTNPRHNYLNQKNDKEVDKRLNASRRMFAYKAGTLSEEFYNEVCGYAGLNYSVEAMSGWHFFKPYLILNDSITPPFIYKNDKFQLHNEDREAFNKFLDSAGAEDILVGQNAPDADYLRHINSAGQTASLKDDKLLDSQYAGQSLYFLRKAKVDAIQTVYDNRVDAEDELGQLYEAKYKSAQFHSGVGFEGYMRMIANGLGVSFDNILSSLGFSGEIVNTYIRMVYGYSGTFTEFLRDFSLSTYPMGFNMSHIDTTTGRLNFKARFSEYFTYSKEYTPYLKEFFKGIGADFMLDGGSSYTSTSHSSSDDEDSDDYQPSSSEPNYEKSDSFKDTTTYTSENAETPDDSTEEAEKPKTDAEIRAEVEAEYGDLLKNSIIPRLRSKHKYKASLTVDIMYEIMIQCMVEAVKERGE